MRHGPWAVLTIAIVTFGASCSTPNLYVTSTADKEYRFSQTPGYRLKPYLGLSSESYRLRDGIVEALNTHKLHPAKDPSATNFELEVYYYPSANVTAMETPYWIGEHGERWYSVSPARTQIESNLNESNHPLSGLQMILIRRGETVMIPIDTLWKAYLITDSSFIHNSPYEIADLMLDYFGKNKSKQGNLRDPAKKRR